MKASVLPTKLAHAQPALLASVLPTKPAHAQQALLARCHTGRRVQSLRALGNLSATGTEAGRSVSAQELWICGGGSAVHV